MSGKRFNFTPTPTDPEAFHITDVSNLTGILHEGGLYSDHHLAARGNAPTMIGYSHVKELRLKKPVPSVPGTTVGHFVPFYFCPRSEMLFIANQGGTGRPRGCQDTIIHLATHVSRLVALPRDWAFTTTNAAAGYTQEFFRDLSELPRIEWDVMNRVFWMECSDERNAEFLVREFVPFSVFERITVRTGATKAAVEQALRAGGLALPVDVRADWYYP